MWAQESRYNLHNILINSDLIKKDTIKCVNFNKDRTKCNLYKFEWKNKNYEDQYKEFYNFFTYVFLIDQYIRDLKRASTEIRIGMRVQKFGFHPESGVDAKRQMLTGKTVPFKQYGGKYIRVKWDNVDYTKPHIKMQYEAISDLRPEGFEDIYKEKSVTEINNIFENLREKLLNIPTTVKPKYHIPEVEDFIGNLGVYRKIKEDIIKDEISIENLLKENQKILDKFTENSEFILVDDRQNNGLILENQQLTKYKYTKDSKIFEGRVDLKENHSSTFFDKRVMCPNNVGNELDTCLSEDRAKQIIDNKQYDKLEILKEYLNNSFNEIRYSYRDLIIEQRKNGIISKKIYKNFIKCKLSLDHLKSSI